MTTTYEPNQVLSNKEFKVVGTRPVRPDGADKVTGRAQYGADLQLTGLIYAKTLRSPHAHANIKSIDFTKALALEGVKAVVSAKDFPKTKDTANYGLGDSPMNYFRGNIFGPFFFYFIQIFFYYFGQIRMNFGAIIFNFVINFSPRIN